MPTIYLSPSTQQDNPYITGSGSEEYNMNLLADYMIPYLLANAIQYSRNTPDMTAASSIRQANAGNYDFYLALHSNAAGAGQSGKARGIIAFYYPGSVQGERAADIFARNLREIYPLPNKVTAQATTTLGEVRLPRAPSVLMEIGYHDNYSDASWVESHMDAIAQNLVRSLTEFFGLPFFYPMTPQDGVVAVGYGSLALRDYPSTQGRLLAHMPKGASVRIFGSREGWYALHFGELVGYGAAPFIEI